MISRKSSFALAIGLSLSASSIAVAQGAAPAAAAPQLTAAERAKYESSYDLTTPDGKQLVVTLFSAGDKLRAAATGEADTLSLSYQGNDTFLSENDPKFKLTVIFANAVPVRLHVVDPGGNELDGVARHNAAPAAPGAPAQAGAPAKPK